ncbi:helix-turn-helix domain-containing protein [Marinococcus luteus]|uniref:helix-turn-helix domain-containing protein n=1 Tax=Marinococcus luteus TaxID=1122204 RepID=UPI002ACD1139|nr:AraC family transcriptional regulator [Marinococcus luteus]MDZ5782041.1 AraC family transcriptional regulator [Marinococcus luteus]
MSMNYERFRSLYGREIEKMEQAENEELVQLYMAQNRFFDCIFRSRKKEAKNELATIYRVILLEPEDEKRLLVLKQYYFFLIGGFLDRYTQTFSYNKKALAASVALINVMEEWEREEEFYEGIDVLVDGMLDTTWNEDFQSYNNPIISRFITLVNQQLYKELNTEILSKQLGISHSHISRLVNEELGTSIPNYVTYKRAEEAAYLLKATTQPVKSIAERLRFSSASYFGVCFKSIHGCTPRQYRIFTAQR